MSRPARCAVIARLVGSITVATTVMLAEASPAAAQLGERVRAVEDGTVRFAFALKAGVEICERGIWMGDRRVSWRSRGFDGSARSCRTDVAEVDLEVGGGLVRDVSVLRPLDDRPANVVNLGEVPARDAADFFVGLAHEGATSNGAKEAIFPATIADVDDLWRDLLVIARAEAVHGDVRKNALFWLGQEAADATDDLFDVALDDDEDQEIRNAAIFAISQRPSDQAIPALMEVARSAEQAESRRTAMFWLAQSEDERVVGFFEQVLLGRIR